ncbi:class I SAM-dependent methyltransferase [Rickettsiales bacterium LUAb2]
MSAISYFDSNALNYDIRNQKLTLTKDALHQLIQIIFSEFKHNANILCVGAGTGTELIYLAKHFPNFHFTALDPSKAMLDVCKQRITDAGYLDRCDFHNGYIDTLKTSKLYDGVTSILVSQFILDENDRHKFFQQIFNKLVPNGILINADLAANTSSASYKELLNLWAKLFNDDFKLAEQQVNNLHEAYTKSVGVIPYNKVQQLIMNAGFKSANLFFQSLLLHGFIATKNI